MKKLDPKSPFGMLVALATETERKKLEAEATPKKLPPKPCPRGCGRYCAVISTTGVHAPYCAECRREINKEYRRCANKKH